MNLVVVGALAYLVVGGVFALLVYLVDRGDGREYARTLGQWWTLPLYIALVLLWPPAVLVLGVGVITGVLS